ncbi:hypothetical protein AAVH_09261 [Aphelenchoides avenae]|nr:hypothetical protein AAVH_09261 [Aphelenchus avenae]
MKLSSISKGGAPEQLSPSKSPLRSLILCRKATFVNRIRATVDVYGGQENIKQMANVQVDPMAVAMALRAEFRVICEYLRTCGLMEDGLENISLEGLATTCLYTWMIYEGALNTVRNGGHQLNRVFFIDESYLPCNEDRVKEFYRGDPTVVDAESVARHGMDYFSEGLQLALKFYKARLDEAEQAALTQLFVIKTASELTRSPEMFATALSQVFENLKQHYVQNYDDVALKMGGIVLLLQELMHVRRLFDEHVIILKLNGKRTVLSEVEGPVAQSPVFAPKEEPASPIEVKHCLPTVH